MILATNPNPFFATGLPTDEKSVPSSAALFSSKSVILSIFICFSRGLSNNADSHASSSSATRNLTFSKTNCPDAIFRITRETDHVLGNVNYCGSSHVLRATWRDTGLMFFIFPIPRITAFSAIFGETRVSSDPLSHLPVLFIFPFPRKKCT